MPSIHRVVVPFVEPGSWVEYSSCLFDHKWKLNDSLCSGWQLLFDDEMRFNWFWLNSRSVSRSHSTARVIVIQRDEIEFGLVFRPPPLGINNALKLLKHKQSSGRVGIIVDNYNLPLHCSVSVSSFFTPPAAGHVNAIGLVLDSCCCVATKSWSSYHERTTLTGKGIINWQSPETRRGKQELWLQQKPRIIGRL